MRFATNIDGRGANWMNGDTGCVFVETIVIAWRRPPHAFVLY
jgi:hypothetical protein